MRPRSIAVLYVGGVVRVWLLFGRRRVPVARAV